MKNNGRSRFIVIKNLDNIACSIHAFVLYRRKLFVADSRRKDCRCFWYILKNFAKTMLFREFFFGLKQFHSISCLFVKCSLVMFCSNEFNKHFLIRCSRLILLLFWNSEEKNAYNNNCCFCCWCDALRKEVKKIAFKFK